MICPHCNKRTPQTLHQCVHCDRRVEPDGVDKLSREFGEDREQFKALVAKSLVVFAVLGGAALALNFYSQSGANAERMLANGYIPDYHIEICERGMNSTRRAELKAAGYTLASRRSANVQTTIDHIFGVNECWSRSVGPARPAESSLPPGATIKIEWSEPPF